MTPPEAARTWYNRTFRRVIDYLHANPGRWVQSYEIAAYLYADDPEGGSLWAHHLVHGTVAANRDRMLAAGWRVVGKRKLGYRLEPA